MDTLAMLWTETGWQMVCGGGLLMVIGAREAFDVLSGRRHFVERSSRARRYDLAGIEDFVVAERMMLERA